MRLCNKRVSEDYLKVRNLLCSGENKKDIFGDTYTLYWTTMLIWIYITLKSGRHITPHINLKPNQPVFIIMP